jgi:lipopolysaccharide transport system ATP-binding protein
MNASICVDNLAKLYRIDPRQQSYATLRDSIAEGCQSAWRRVNRCFSRSQPECGQKRLVGEDFWALKNISFELKQGEVVGVVGRNGAGKSTLLKVLSRITEPTRGQARLRGRVGSLLEVGSGFHPELSGRENIYMNGSILGMTRQEINRRFDEIVAFSETEDFLDTPVKRYSSGMYVRLAFAVAAHLESEIFIVDEVLAVGDAAFQQKCTRKMRDVSQDGRTILFVSHNFNSISALCDRVLVLADGELQTDAPTAAGLRAYKQAVEQVAALPLRQRRDRRGDGGIRFVEFESGDSPLLKEPPATGGQCRFRVTLEAHEAFGKSQPIDVAVILRDSDQRRVTTLSTHFIGASQPLRDGQAQLDFVIPRLPLLAGSYQVDLWCGVGAVEEDVVEGAAILDVQEGTYYPTSTDFRMPRLDWHGPALLDFAVEHS